MKIPAKTILHCSSLIVFNFLFQHFLPLGCKRVMSSFVTLLSGRVSRWAGGVDAYVCEFDHLRTRQRRSFKFTS